MRYTMLVEAVERAARSGRRLRLEADAARALIESDAWPLLQDAKTRELIASWIGEEAAPTPTASPDDDQQPELSETLHRAAEARARSTCDDLRRLDRRRRFTKP